MHIYTDGSCKKTKVGAYGFITVVGDKIEMSFAKRHHRTTNNQMELMALISALEYIRKTGFKNIDLYSDSEYVVKGYSRWTHKWEANGWKTAGGNAVSNQALWHKVIKLRTDLEKANADPNVQWVKAHGSNKYNNFIDNLVQNIAK